MALALLSETYEDGTWSSTFHHCESIQAFVKDLTQEDFITLLRLSSSALKHLHTSAGNQKYKEALAVEIDSHTRRIKDTAKQEKEALLYEKESEANRHSMEILRLKATIEELQIQNKSIKTQFEDISKAGQETFRTSLAAIKAEKDEQYTKEIERIREDMKERIAEVQKIYTETTSKSKKESYVSSEIGKKGEREFKELAAEYTSWGDMEDTSKVAHNADLACMIRKTNTLFEIKNYSSDAPTREVTKFEDDMKLHSNIPFGVFISMKTGIVGKRFDKPIIIDWTSNSQMLVYISSFLSQDMPAMFLFIDMCADIAYRCYRLIQDRPEDSETCLRLQRKVQGIQSLVEKELVTLGTWVRDMKSEHQVAMDLLEKQHTMNLAKLVHMKDSLGHMISIMGGDDSPPASEVVQLEPVQVKEKPKKVKKKELS
jgi:hypothetical protein